MPTETLTAVEASDLFRSEPTAYIDVGAGEVGLRSIGSGPDVVFVHGWPVSGATFRGLLPYLVEHVTCHVIDLPGAGSSRFDGATTITVDRHIETVRQVVDQLGLDDIAVVGHDSGGMIARHALAGDQRVRSWGLIDTEQPAGLSWRFRQFLLSAKIPGFGAALAWVLGKPRLRRSELVLGGAFRDRTLVDGEFEEFFLRPIHTDRKRRDAAMKLLDSFDVSYVSALAEIHRRINVPVQLVWGEDDPFFPLPWAKAMATTFTDAHLAIIPGTRLFCHEERPNEVAAALLPLLTKSPSQQ